MNAINKILQRDKVLKEQAKDVEATVEKLMNGKNPMTRSQALKRIKKAIIRSLKR